MLVGILAGASVAGIRFIAIGLRRIHYTTSYSVGTFAVTACGMKVWGDRRQREEAKGIAAAVTGMKMLHEKRDREAKEKKMKEEEDKRRREEEERKRKSWKWW